MSLSVAELEQQLAERRAEAEAQAKRLAEQAKEQEARRRRLARDGQGLVTELEQVTAQLPEQMAGLAEQAGTPPFLLRVAARRLQRGILEPRREASSGEVIGEPQEHVTGTDLAADVAWRVNERAHRAQLELGELGPEHPLIERLDVVECQSWRAFCHRLSVLAGEVDA
jgi:hypothetical protein